MAYPGDFYNTVVNATDHVTVCTDQFLQTMMQNFRTDVVPISVKEYGATGDGSTDDSTAIQAAIDAANSAGGGTVFFPLATYAILTGLTLYDDITLDLQGSTIKCTATAAAIAMIGATSKSRICIKNGILDGDRASAKSSYGVYMISGSSADITVYNVKFVNIGDATQDGAAAHDTGGSGAMGLRIEGSSGNERIKIIGCEFIEIDGNAMSISQFTDSRIALNSFYHVGYKSDGFTCTGTPTGQGHLLLCSNTDSIGSEILDETNFATYAKWDITEEEVGIVDLTGGNAAFTYNAPGGTLNGTLTQTAANRVSTGTDSSWYTFTYTIAVTTLPDGDFDLSITDFAATSTTLPFTAGTHSVLFQASASATSEDFTITASETNSTEGIFTIDDVTLKSASIEPHAQRVVVEGNTSYLSADSGIRFAGGSNDIVIANNVIRGAGKDAIKFDPPNDADSSGDCIIANVTVANNIIYDFNSDAARNSDVAIKIQNNANPTVNPIGVMITGNTVDDYIKCLDLNHVEAVVVGNEFGHGSDWCIQLSGVDSGSSKYVIAHNKFNFGGSTSEGIRVADTNVTYLSVQGNQFVGDGTSSGGRPILLEANVTRIDFANNIIDSTRSAIDFASYTTELYYQDNTEVSIQQATIFESSSNVTWHNRSGEVNDQSGNYTVKLTDLGKTITNVGAVGLTTHTLPTATPYKEYTFIRLATQDMHINPSGNELFRGQAAGDEMIFDADGEGATIKCFTAGIWEVLQTQGTITYAASP
jgi:hypothetical protein